MNGSSNLRRLADLRRLVDAFPSADTSAVAAARARDAGLTKPAGALGRLEDIAFWLAAWQGSAGPRVERVQALVFAGNHGVAARGVSAYPAEVTAQMVANFAAGGAAINQLCRSVGAELDVVALDLDRPTADFTEAPAMSESDCLAAVERGMAALMDGVELLCVGEMGIANTTAAAAMALALFGGAAADWVGLGTGVDSAGLAAKRGVVEAAVACHGAALADPLEVLRRLGGRELAAIFGAVVAARLKRVPVLLDGFVACAAAAPLHVMSSAGLDHCEVGHCSAEQAHGRLLDRLAKRPLLDLGMRLGEGSGAVLAVGLVKAAAAVHTGMASFAEAGVAERRED